MNNIPHHSTWYPGMRFYNWILIQRVPDKKKSSQITKNRWRVECQCELKTRVTVPRHYFLRVKNPKKDCGCSRKTLRTTQPREYSIWQMMRRRCNYPSHVSYKYYGGRGIKVFPEWDTQKTGFEAFFAYMGPAPSLEYTLDRWPDNDDGYHPGNVRWATAKEQRANQRPRQYKKNKS